MLSIVWLTGFAPLGCSSSSPAPNGAGADASAPGADSGSPGDDAGVGLALYAYASARAKQECAMLEPCCTTSGYPVADTACMTALEKKYQDEITREQAGAHTYDALAAAACLAQNASLFHGCTLDPRPRGGPCDRIWTGTVAPGGACHWDDDCAPVPGYSVYCDTSGPWLCETLPHEGERCAPVAGSTQYLACDEGLYCDTTQVTATCMRQQPDGVGCMASSPNECRTGACDLTRGVCVEPPATGSPCASGATLCAAGLRCDEKTNVCGAPLAIGASCYGDFDCDPSSAYCDNATSKCTAKKSAGASCAAAHECASGSCDPDTCAAVNEGIATSVICRALGAK